MPSSDQAHFLRDLRLRPGDRDERRFPFSVPTIRTLEVLRTDTPVTFFVGENGSGKSTLLEAIAIAARLPAVGSADLARDDSLGEQRYLAHALTLTWSRHTARGFFLRAEDFFGFTKRVSAMRSEFRAQLAEIERDYVDRSEQAKMLATLPVKRSLAELEQMYGEDLDANSHGQSFLRLFSSRFVPGGLYLLDEPEAPLSPQSQLALLVMMQEMVAQQAQFIIATHSPMLLAFPGARIYSFDATPVQEVPFDELDHVVLMREFLNRPERYLRAIFR
ncbi:MAG TPA: AAA family ATPase [Gemmatimonadaceae bacterium]|nr:AAA family ATPase [Gemmatimonadaceae bacterium]